jgi:hypothetical protein
MYLDPEMKVDALRAAAIMFPSLRDSFFNKLSCAYDMIREWAILQHRQRE